MSGDETQSALSRAYELVEAGKYEEARAILDPILVADKDNADAWWIYAHAVTNPEDGRTALENVLRIDPKYPEAAELLAQAREMEPEPPKIAPVTLPPHTIPEAPPHLPEAAPQLRVGFPELEFEESDNITSEPTAPAARRGLPIMPILAVIVIVILVLLVLLSQNGDGSSSATSTPTAVAAVLVTPTVVAQAATNEITALVQPTLIEVTQSVTSTEIPTAAVSSTQEATALMGAPTPEATSADYTGIQTALAQFPLAAGGISAVQTSLGNTVQVTVCTTQGRAMRTLLPQVMDALAKQSTTLDNSVQAIGVHMINCDQNAALLTVAVDLTSAQSYAQGGLSETQFTSKWKPQ